MRIVGRNGARGIGERPAASDTAGTPGSVRTGSDATKARHQAEAKRRIRIGRIVDPKDLQYIEQWLGPDRQKYEKEAQALIDKGRVVSIDDVRFIHFFLGEK